MAGLLRSLGNLLDKLKGKPKPPKVKPRGPEGHRGIAIGSTKRPDLSPENIAKWQRLSSDQTTAFLYEQEPLFVHSTNVVMAQWFPDEGKMAVEYHDGKYLYSQVTHAEALSFVQAQSKGAWIWDTFRVRGSQTAHKKPYVRIG